MQRQVHCQTLMKTQDHRRHKQLMLSFGYAAMLLRDAALQLETMTVETEDKVRTSSFGRNTFKMW